MGQSNGVHALTDRLSRIQALGLARSLLFLPASNARAVEKARSLPCDMVILDLEDAVVAADKAAARDAAVAAITQGFGDRLTGIRINAQGTADWHGLDMLAMVKAKPDFVVLPKVSSVKQIYDVAAIVGRQVIAMIEDGAGLLAAPAIAAEHHTAALFVGVNDLRHSLDIPAGGAREGLMTALQSVLIAARAFGKPAFDGVYNKLDDPEGFAAECAQGRAWGFAGKTLIHPGQIDSANRLFGPDAESVARARRLVDAATGGAERFEGEMVEAMHVAQARAVIAAAER